MSNVGLDTAIETHIDLIQFFRDGHWTTAEIIAERYGIGLRTAQRYLQRVDRYVPLERSGPRGRNYRKLRI